MRSCGDCGRETATVDARICRYHIAVASITVTPGSRTILKCARKIIYRLQNEILPDNYRNKKGVGNIQLNSSREHHACS
jgi:hypothetical protein